MMTVTRERCPLGHGTVLRFVRGGHRGMLVYVDEPYCFWDWNYERWEIVLALYAPGEAKNGMHFLRAPYSEVMDYCELEEVEK